MNWYLGVLKNYAGFSGRARRKEFWMFVLFHIIATLIVVAVDFAVGLNSILVGVYVLGVFVPSLALIVRRLHDIGKSGWFYFIILIPLVGQILLLVWFLTAGNPEANAYGENPKLVPAKA
ncbi:DUF805 domain-containing protein [Streptomyces sp. NPDC051569]|uniref:DUF805 domain-containing protein n=1 Tax=Streptomyces sp. NPDC051569 TaxID=3365661 RepID=UPI00379C54B0